MKWLSAEKAVVGWQMWADGDGDGDRDGDGGCRWPLWAGGSSWMAVSGDGDGSCGQMEMAVLRWLLAEMEMVAVGR
jgi:hypothetical protein